MMIFIHWFFEDYSGILRWRSIFISNLGPYDEFKPISRSATRKFWKSKDQTWIFQCFRAGGPYIWPIYDDQIAVGTPKGNTRGIFPQNKWAEAKNLVLNFNLFQLINEYNPRYMWITNHLLASTRDRDPRVRSWCVLPSWWDCVGFLPAVNIENPMLKIPNSTWDWRWNIHFLRFLTTPENPPLKTSILCDPEAENSKKQKTTWARDWNSRLFLACSLNCQAFFFGFAWF